MSGFYDGSTRVAVSLWYRKEFGRIFNLYMAIEEAATYALTKLKERVASKNGGQVPEMATLGNQNVEMPENELQLFCSRYGLKSDAQKFKSALDWLERRRLVSRYAKPNAATRRSTDVVRLEIKMRCAVGVTTDESTGSKHRSPGSPEL